MPDHASTDVAISIADAALAASALYFDITTAFEWGMDDGLLTKAQAQLRLCEFLAARVREDAPELAIETFSEADRWPTAGLGERLVAWREECQEL